jgi:hypothetical protein
VISANFRMISAFDFSYFFPSGPKKARLRNSSFFTSVSGS